MLFIIQNPVIVNRNADFFNKTKILFVIRIGMLCPHEVGKNWTIHLSAVVQIGPSWNPFYRCPQLHSDWNLYSHLFWLKP